jgi:hypothetical protein
LHVNIGASWFEALSQEFGKPYFVKVLHNCWRMPCSGMSCRIGLVRTDVSEERVCSIFRVARICERETVLPARSHNTCLAPHPQRSAFLINTTYKLLVVTLQHHHDRVAGLGFF